MTGTIEQIKKGNIAILPEVITISKNEVLFSNKTKQQFDQIICATSYEIDLSFLQLELPKSSSVQLNNFLENNPIDRLHFIGFKNKAGGTLQQIYLEALTLQNELNSKTSSSRII